MPELKTNEYSVKRILSNHAQVVDREPAPFSHCRSLHLLFYTHRLVVNRETFNNFILCVYMTFTGQHDNSMIRLQTAEKTRDSCGVYRD